MNNINLTDKLSFLIISAVLASIIGLGLYFDTFLKENDLDATKKRMQHVYTRIESDIKKVSNELLQGISFIQTDENFISSIDLINNYQNKEDYNAILLDEEKKYIAEQLLYKVKFSLNHSICLYDKNEELIAFVTKKDKEYFLFFISYEDGKKVLYSKSEYKNRFVKAPEEDYISIPYKHVSYYKQKDLQKGSLLTYHLSNDELIIKSHQSIFDKKHKNTNAHIEMSYQLGEHYFKALSDDLNIDISTSLKGSYNKNTDAMQIIQTDSDYFANTSIMTEDGRLYIQARLNKEILNTTLNENREKLFYFLLLIIITVPVLLHYLFNKLLSTPLKTLMIQINKMEHSDYSHSEEVQTRDELEKISKNINQLALKIKEREAALQESRNDLEYLSTHDSLTNLPNRRLFLNNLEYAIKIAKRNHTKLAVLFIDLDKFKHINDTYGHTIGDELLKAVSDRILKTLRDSDTLARIGGDEFNILLENIKDIKDIETIVNKLFHDFIAPFACKDYAIKTTISIGISIFPEDGQDSVTLTKNADIAMYKAKDDGRNNYSFFSEELSKRLEKQTRLTNALKFAIESKNEFFLLYQPKISLKTGKIVSIEALIRWHNPLLGFVMPNDFIPLAEETQLIISIGEWVFQQACQDFVVLQEEGYSLEHISVNVSSVQLNNGTLIQTIQEIIQKTGIDSNCIELEITESYIATNEEAAIKTLQQFREMGIDLAIDDFGTGYSSMSYLQKLPVTRLKIDKSFIDDLLSSDESNALVRAIIVLAKTFALEITAEGVETYEQVQFLQEEQCDEIQGYYYSKPLSLDALKTYMDHN
ncbi:EAL domain-containing protein [bacterium]|nr:EAL domain-containing protein [bacterium]MBU1991011.1 EAL domain-containing protein [bacterium]